MNNILLLSICVNYTEETRNQLAYYELRTTLTAEVDNIIVKYTFVWYHGAIVTGRFTERLYLSGDRCGTISSQANT